MSVIKVSKQAGPNYQKAITKIVNEKNIVPKNIDRFNTLTKKYEKVAIELIDDAKSYVQSMQTMRGENPKI